MLISHEVPIKALKESRSFNDYDYALVHLFSEYPDYLDFFVKSLQKNRIVYLDNSQYELHLKGLEFDVESFADYCDFFYNINKEKFYYIIPDVFNNYSKTIENFNNFTFKKGKKIGVCQGSNNQELLECFKFMKDKADIVAISFGYDHFKLGSNTEAQNMMLNRINFIKDLLNKDLIKNTKIHLLGCALPQEIKNYRNIPEIISIDTSNPITNGYLGISYDNDLSEKPKVLMEDLMDIELNDIMRYNISKFKDYYKEVL